MANNDFVRLAQGAQNDYATLTKDANTLYFCTDTQRLFLGDKEYTRPITVGSSAPTTASASQYPPYSLYFNNNATTGGILYYTDGTAWNQIYNLTQISKQFSRRAEIFHGYCGTAAGTTAKVVDCPEFGSTDLAKGVLLFVTFDYTNSGTASSLTMNVNGTGAKSIKKNYNASIANLTSAGELRANETYLFTYDGTYWTLITSDYNSTYYYTSIYCTTAAGTAAKAASVSNQHTLEAGKYFQVWIYYANTAQSALTLNISNKGAKPIYINGEPSSATNYTLPAGCYIVHYDGTNYYFRTDNKLTANITGDAATVNGHTVLSDVPVGAKFTDENTTYTFTGGTNKFTVTGSDGSSNDIAVTPSIANNITGSGTSGYLIKFNGTNTIMNGPQLGSDTTKFLRNDGTWVVPTGTYSLPLAASGTRGGIQIGYTASGTNYPVQLSNEKAYVSVPWTDTKQNITLGTTTKAYITGVSTTPTATAQALTGIADTGVYLTAAAGEISAARHSWNVSGTEKAYTTYNSTTDSIDFIFV